MTQGADTSTNDERSGAVRSLHALVIVEDEALRDSIGRLLSGEPDVRPLVVDVTESPSFLGTRPALIVLEIALCHGRMAQEIGVLMGRVPCALIGLARHPGLAADAFTLGAADCLALPIDARRWRQAMQRARRALFIAELGDSIL